MVPDRPLVLIGPMASGKSAVGRMLAHRTGSRFLDTDREIVERHGSISSIFASQGEQAFRTFEADVVRAALGLDGVVVSLGGGAVLHAGTRELLADTTVVLLDTDLRTVLPRITGDTGRPLLAGRPAERWQEIYDERRPLYVAVASLVIDTRGLSLREVTEAVLLAVRPAQQPGGNATAPRTDTNEESGTNTHDH